MSSCRSDARVVEQRGSNAATVRASDTVSRASRWSERHRFCELTRDESGLTLDPMSRWATMFVALLLASALATSTLASCLAVPAGAPEAQMACCAHGHDQCPMHRSPGQSAADCCQHDSQRQQTLTAAEQRPVHTLTISFQQIAAVTPHAPILIAPDSTTFARYPSRSASPPTPRPSLSTVLLI